MVAMVAAAGRSLQVAPNASSAIDRVRAQRICQYSISYEQLAEYSLHLRVPRRLLQCADTVALWGDWLLDSSSQLSAFSVAISTSRKVFSDLILVELVSPNRVAVSGNPTA